MGINGTGGKLKIMVIPQRLGRNWWHHPMMAQPSASRDVYIEGERTGTVLVIIAYLPAALSLVHVKTSVCVCVYPLPRQI